MIYLWNKKEKKNQKLYQRFFPLGFIGLYSISKYNKQEKEKKRRRMKPIDYLNVINISKYVQQEIVFIVHLHCYGSRLFYTEK